MKTTVYIVQQRHWEWQGEEYVHNVALDTPLKAFRQRQRAEAYRQELEDLNAAEHAALVEANLAFDNPSDPNLALYEIVGVPLEP
jgi:hypothetical protein